jgi:hypothetical protein
MIFVSRRCRRIPQIVSALIRVNLREIIFLRFADFNICCQKKEISRYIDDFPAHSRGGPIHFFLDEN